MISHSHDPGDADCAACPETWGNPAAIPANTDDSGECQRSDWCGPGSHCLCVPAARPAEPPGELLSDEWWTNLFRTTADAVDYVPYAAASEYPVPHVAAFRAAAEPLLAPLLADRATVKRVEHLYAVLVEGGAVFATLPDLRRALDGPQ